MNQACLFVFPLRCMARTEARCGVGPSVRGAATGLRRSVPARCACAVARSPRRRGAGRASQDDRTWDVGTRRAGLLASS